MNIFLKKTLQYLKILTIMTIVIIFLNYNLNVIECCDENGPHDIPYMAQNVPQNAQPRIVRESSLMVVKLTFSILTKEPTVYESHLIFWVNIALGTFASITTQSYWAYGVTILNLMGEIFSEDIEVENKKFIWFVSFLTLVVLLKDYII